MIEYYKTQDNAIVRIPELEEDCWINLVSPTEHELTEISHQLQVEQDFLRAALDEEETSRIETEDNCTLVILDVPYVDDETTNGMLMYSTLPMGVIITPKNIITVCLKESLILLEFANNYVKQVFTRMKTRFLLQILYRVSTKYLTYLRQVDKLSSSVEKQLHLSMKNKELIQLLDLEKSLVYFSTSLKANEITMTKIKRGRFVKMYEEDEELLEDVLIETNQAIEMSTIYSSILSGMMDAFASVISNNLNIVMKVLTSITILMAVPTMISSFYGMNVHDLPLPSFYFVLPFTIVITLIAALVLYKKKMF